MSDEPEAGAGSPTASGREALPGAGERVVGDGLCDEVVAGELDDEGAAEEPDEGAALWEDAGTTALSEEVAAVETEEAEAEAEAEDADEDSLDEAGVAAVGTSLLAPLPLAAGASPGVPAGVGADWMAVGATLALMSGLAVGAVPLAEDEGSTEGRTMSDGPDGVGADGAEEDDLDFGRHLGWTADAVVKNELTLLVLLALLALLALATSLLALATSLLVAFGLIVTRGSRRRRSTGEAAAPVSARSAPRTNVAFMGI